MDYAIIASGGKQYKVAPGRAVKLEKLEHEVGSEISLDKVLLIKTGDSAAQVGKPYVEGAKVNVKIVEHGRGDKIKIIHFKRRKHQLKRMGHRQHYTKVLVSDLVV